MAFRLIFESDGNEIRLVRKNRVDMIAPASPTDDAEFGPGIYAETRDDADRTLHRSNISSYLAPTIEAFGPEGMINRVDAPDQKRVIVLVVPDPPEASSLVVVRRAGAPMASRGRFTPEALATEDVLMRVPLDEDNE